MAEVTELEVGVLVAIICVFLLVFVWFFLSKRREVRESRAAEKTIPQAKPTKRSRHVDDPDTDTSEDSDHDEPVSKVDDDDCYLQQLQETRQARQRKHVSDVQQPKVQQQKIVQQQKMVQQPAAEVPLKQVAQIQQLLQTASCIKRGSPSIYKIPVKITKTVAEGIEKAEVGTPHPTPKPTRVFMAVGATGAGKSTLINAMVNYFMGVKFEDDCRFKLITDEVKQSQAHSQTQKITSYTIYWHEASPVDYNLIIIDTPGFGDTRGVAQDKRITAQIKDFFSLKGDAGIDQIHGIGFVAQSSMVRLTQTQKYVFDSVLSVFGKDIANNIFIMSTFSDGAEPPVKGAIKAAEVPHCNFVQFNNEYLFASNTTSIDVNGAFWNLAYESFKKFFTHFTRTETVSLQLTRDVLKERQHLETVVTGLQKNISDGIKKIDVLNQEEQVMRKHEADILKNKDFKYKVKTFKHRKVDISGQGRYVTNCQKCNFTCHESCVYANDGDKHRCAAMDGRGQANASCRVCPATCHWTLHKNNPYYFETYEEEETRTLSDLKKEYQSSSTKITGVQGMIQKLEEELENLYSQVFLDVRKVRKCLDRLGEIALKPSPLTDADYIGLLIQAEKNEQKPGFKKRIEYLSEVKEQAELMADLKDDEIEKLTREGAKMWWKKFQNKKKSQEKSCT